MTKQLKASGEATGVLLVNSVVCGYDGWYTSLVELGLLYGHIGALPCQSLAVVLVATASDGRCPAGLPFGVSPRADRARQPDAGRQ